MSGTLEILKDFQDESKNLIVNMQQILEVCEGNFEQVQSLAEYASYADRIMGAAKTIATQFDHAHIIYKIADYTALCKALGYQASQVSYNTELYNASVAILLDATEILNDLIERMLNSRPPVLREMVSKTLIDRLKWMSNLYNPDYSKTVAMKTAAGTTVAPDSGVAQNSNLTKAQEAAAAATADAKPKEQSKVLVQGEIDDLLKSLGLT